MQGVGRHCTGKRLSRTVWSSFKKEGMSYLCDCTVAGQTARRDNIPASKCEYPPLSVIPHFNFKCAWTSSLKHSLDPLLCRFGHLSAGFEFGVDIFYFEVLVWVLKLRLCPLRCQSWVLPSASLSKRNGKQTEINTTLGKAVQAVLSKTDLHELPPTSLKIKQWSYNRSRCRIVARGRGNELLPSIQHLHAFAWPISHYLVVSRVKPCTECLR